MTPQVRPMEAPRVVPASGGGWRVWDPSAHNPRSEWFADLTEATAYFDQCREAWANRPDTVTVTLTQREVEWLLASVSVNHERIEKKRGKGAAYIAWTEELLALRERFANTLNEMTEGKR